MNALRETVPYEFDGEIYDLELTTYSIQQIAKKAGGIENIESSLTNESASEQFDFAIWIITLLMNQSIMKWNYKHSEKKKLLTEEYVALFTDFDDLTNMVNIISQVLENGTKKAIESEPSKNLTAE